MMHIGGKFTSVCVHLYLNRPRGKRIYIAADVIQPYAY